MQSKRLDLEQELKNTINLLFSRQAHTPPKNLADAIEYSLFAPGKRIRPRLALMTADALELKMDLVLPVALSLEMFHCFTLIHDDLPCLDNDDFRRGRPSNHKVFGEGLALLAGDALFSVAFETFCLAKNNFPTQNFFRALDYFLKVCGPSGVVGGQAAEMLLEKDHQSLDQLLEMHEGKTGALFHGSIMIPAALAGLTPETPRWKALYEYAYALGQLFQVVDDFEDAEQDQNRVNPISVLTYLNKEEARTRFVSQMVRAQGNLKRELSTANDLIAISEEVISRAKTA
jgi:geranylgeranyl diphosphate synthase type II